MVNNQLFFKEGLLHEDTLFTLQAFWLTKKVGYADIIFYNYRRDNINSITNNKTVKNYRHTLYIINELIDFQNSLKQDNAYINSLLIAYYWSIVRTVGIKNNEIFNKLKKLKINLKGKLIKNIKVKIKIILIYIISLKIKNEELPKL